MEQLSATIHACPLHPLSTGQDPLIAGKNLFLPQNQLNSFLISGRAI